MSTTTVDDQSTSVQYTGTWVKGGTPNEYQGTVASSTIVGDSFTLTFTGTSIAVYGTLDDFSAGAAATYAIDGAAAVEKVAPSAHGDTFNQLFWQSEPNLSNAQHTLVVKMTRVNPNPQQGEGTIWFDYFTITTPPLPPTTFTSPTSSIVSSSYGTSTSTSSSTVTGTQVPATNPNNNTSSKSTPTGAIIGAVVAGLIIILAFVAFLLYRRRQRPGQATLVQQGKPYVDNEVPPHLPFTPGPGPLPSQFSAQPFLPAMSFDSAPRNPSPPIIPPNQYYNAANAPPMSQFANAATSYDPRALVPAGAMAAGTHQYHNSIGTGEGAYPAFNPYDIPTPTSIPYTGTSTGADTGDQGGLAAEKRRQQEVVLSYNGGIGGSPQPPVLQQHVDSGLRAIGDGNVGPSMRVELPPVYTAV